MIENTKEASLEDRIDGLDEKRAVFCLRILLCANQVERHVMEKTLNLVDVVRFP